MGHSGNKETRKCVQMKDGIFILEVVVVDNVTGDRALAQSASQWVSNLRRRCSRHRRTRSR